MIDCGDFGIDDSPREQDVAEQLLGDTAVMTGCLAWPGDPEAPSGIDQWRQIAPDRGDLIWFRREGDDDVDTFRRLHRDSLPIDQRFCKVPSRRLVPEHAGGSGMQAKLLALWGQGVSCRSWKVIVSCVSIRGCGWGHMLLRMLVAVPNRPATIGES